MGILLHQYRSDAASCNYIFKSGKRAEFHGHMFRTSIKSEIEELDAEIAAGIGAIAIPADGPTIDSDDLDPVSVMKKKIIAEYEADKRRAEDIGVSTSDRSNSGMVNSKTMSEVAGASISGASGAARVITPGKIGK